MKKPIKKKLTMTTCYDCKYSNESDSLNVAWCHEASRELCDSMSIPSWCPLEDAI